MRHIKPDTGKFAVRLFLAAACVCAVLLGENGRNFAGNFQIQNVIEGTAVQFDLKASVTNYSGAPVQNATVTIESSSVRTFPLEAADYRGSISGIKIPYRKNAVLTGTFTIPMREYQQWQRGALPNMFVSYVNASGQQVHDRVDLTLAIGQVR